MIPTVRPLEARDLDAWLPLWNGYNAFYRNEATEEATRKYVPQVARGDGFLRDWKWSGPIWSR